MLAYILKITKRSKKRITNRGKDFKSGKGLQIGSEYHSQVLEK